MIRKRPEQLIVDLAVEPPAIGVRGVAEAIGQLAFDLVVTAKVGEAPWLVGRDRMRHFVVGQRLTSRSAVEA